MATFDSLPNELLAKIGKELSSDIVNHNSPSHHGNFAGLCRANKRYHQFFTSYLYETVIFDEKKPKAQAKFVVTILSKPTLAANIRNLRFHPMVMSSVPQKFIPTIEDEVKRKWGEGNFDQWKKGRSPYLATVLMSLVVPHSINIEHLLLTSQATPEKSHNQYPKYWESLQLAGLQQQLAQSVANVKVSLRGPEGLSLTSIKLLSAFRQSTELHVTGGDLSCYSYLRSSPRQVIFPCLRILNLEHLYVGLWLGLVLESCPNVEQLVLSSSQVEPFGGKVSIENMSFGGLTSARDIGFCIGACAPKLRTLEFPVPVWEEMEDFDYEDPIAITGINRMLTLESLTIHQEDVIDRYSYKYDHDWESTDAIMPPKHSVFVQELPGNLQSLTVLDCDGDILPELRMLARHKGVLSKLTHLTIDHDGERADLFDSLPSIFQSTGRSITITVTPRVRPDW